MHRGICLGFDLPRGKALEVHYDESRIATALQPSEPHNFDRDVEDLLVTTKFEHWKYEKERRVIVELAQASAEGGLYFSAFGEELHLKEVILGPLCAIDLELVRHLIARMHNSDVKAFKSRLAFKTFDIVPDERSVNW
jgi:hypothetical protein